MIPTVVVHVNWPWLTYPAALSVSGGVFLTLVMCLSNERRGIIWKSSSLALLFHGLGSSSERDMSVRQIGVHDTRAMEKTAKEIRARLVEDPSGEVIFRTL